MTLGFAGLGLMGRPMAANLLRAGHTLAVFNRSAAPREALERLGAIAFDNPANFFATCDSVVMMLANDAAVDAVLGRGTADFGSRVGGKLIVNMGTHAPAWSSALERDIRTSGGRFVEAPVSGSRGPAEAGTLVIMAAGDADAVRDSRPILAALGREIVVTGAVPSAMACKLAVNLYLIASVAALAEATALARALHLDLEVFTRVIASGPLGSDVARAKLAKMTHADFAPQAAILDVCKNAALVADAAQAAGLDAGLLRLAEARFATVLAKGGGGLDMAAVITAIEGDGA